MHYRHATVFTAVLCSTALCFAQAQAPVKTTQTKSAQTGQAAVAKLSPADTAKATIHTLHTTADTAKIATSADSVKPAQIPAPQIADTIKTHQVSDTGKIVTPKKSKHSVKKSVHADSAKTSAAPVDTVKPVGAVPASK